MAVSIELAREAERPVVDQLLEFLAYEMSRFDGRPLTDDGRYGYEYLDAYWQEPGSRWPYLIRVGGELTGLALVSRLPTGVSSMSEFLILPKHRRAGVGRVAARRVFGLHPGAWRVAQIAHHAEATAFWRQTIPAAFSEHESDGRVTQEFDVRPDGWIPDDLGSGVEGNSPTAGLQGTGGNR